MVVVVGAESPPRPRVSELFSASPSYGELLFFFIPFFLLRILRVIERDGICRAAGGLESVSVSVGAFCCRAAWDKIRGVGFLWEGFMIGAGIELN